MINWNVRFRNKKFVLSLAGALILLAEQIAKMLGLHLNLSDFNNNLTDVINAIFAVLVILGVVNDPTTHGIRDRERALNYEKPHKGEETNGRNL